MHLWVSIIDVTLIWKHFAIDEVGAELYIPSIINTWRKLPSTAIWADKKWAGF
jgi:hypothetical protein